MVCGLGMSTELILFYKAVSSPWSPRKYTGGTFRSRITGNVEALFRRVHPFNRISTPNHLDTPSDLTITIFKPPKHSLNFFVSFELDTFLFDKV
jgi:hypothetical protein